MRLNQIDLWFVRARRRIRIPPRGGEMKVPGTPPFVRFREKHFSAGDSLLPLIARASSSFDRLPGATTGTCADRGRIKRSRRAAGLSSNHRTHGNATLRTRATFAMSAAVVINCIQIRQLILKNRRSGYLRRSIRFDSGYRLRSRTTRQSEPSCWNAHRSASGGGWITTDRCQFDTDR